MLVDARREIDASQSHFGIAREFIIPAVRAMSTFQDWSMLIRDAKRPRTTRSYIRRGIVSRHERPLYLSLSRTVLFMYTSLAITVSKLAPEYNNECADNTAGTICSLNRETWLSAAVNWRSVILHIYLILRTRRIESSTRLREIINVISWSIAEKLV